MSSVHGGYKCRDLESRRGTVRYALDEQTDYEQVRFRWLFGFIHVRHFFCMIQVAVLYLCTPVLLLYGSNSDNAAVQALFLSLAILVVICVIVSSVAFHWSEKLRYLNNSHVSDRFCQLSPMPFVCLFFLHQVFLFAISLFYLYSTFISSKLHVFSRGVTVPRCVTFLGGGLMPLLMFLGLMVYVIYGDFRFWSYACFVREHTKLKRRLARINEERGVFAPDLAYKSGISYGHVSRASNRSLKSMNMSKNSLRSQHGYNGHSQPPSLRLARNPVACGDYPDALRAQRSLPDLADSLPTIRLPAGGNNPAVYTTDNSDAELIHVLDTIGEVAEENSHSC